MIPLSFKPVRVVTALASLVAALALAAPSAYADAPANDDFTNRAALAEDLPFEVTDSNFEATKETGEQAAGFAAGGHSVWFEWEASITGWVTVSACGESDLTAMVGVYTGTVVDALTSVVGPADRGPGFCGYSEGVYTFWATEGTVYNLAVDGSVFYLPPSAQPSGEGEFTLRLEATPPPANDDFADAETLSGEISEEPDGNRIYYASGDGNNWGAGRQTGEPEHAGDPGGASVWYSWTAPESGKARIGLVNTSLSGAVAVYGGDAVDALSPIAPNDDGPPVDYPVTAGQTYRIAVDGRYDEATEAADLGSFVVLITMVLGPKSPPSEEPAIFDEPLPDRVPSIADTTPPRTRVTARILRHAKRVAKFRFVSNEPGSRFKCRLDRGRYRRCDSPVTFHKLRPGRHVFRVFAIDAAGNRDRSPTIGRFNIAAGKQRLRHGAEHKHRRR
jgi:hypothetical protein